MSNVESLADRTSLDVSLKLEIAWTLLRSPQESEAIE